MDPRYGALERLGDTPERVQERLLKEVHFISRDWNVNGHILSDALIRYREDRQIFSVITDNDGELFPAFQFHFKFPFPAIKTILDSVPQEVVGWPLLTWFATRNTFLGLKRPMDIQKRDFRKVIVVAQHLRVHSG